MKKRRFSVSLSRKRAIGFSPFFFSDSIAHSSHFARLVGSATVSYMRAWVKKGTKHKTHRHLVEELNGLFFLLLHRPPVEECLCSGVAVVVRLHYFRAAEEAVKRRPVRVRREHRGSSVQREGVTGGEEEEKKNRRRDEQIVFDFCSRTFSYFLLLSVCSQSRLPIKLAPFPPPRLLRARSLAAMASSAPSPASAVDFLTLLTRLKVVFACFVEEQSKINQTTSPSKKRRKNSLSTSLANLSPNNETKHRPPSARAGSAGASRGPNPWPTTRSASRCSRSSLPTRRLLLPLLLLLLQPRQQLQSLHPSTRRAP